MEINSIDKPNQKKSLGEYFKIFVYKLGGMAEVVIILFFWLIVFTNTSSVDGFTREEIVTYILVGGVIGLISGYMLNKIMINGISKESIGLLMHSPYKYFFKVFIRTIHKMFIPFVFSVFLQVLLLKFLVDSAVVNFDIYCWLVILVMIFLSIVSEFLMFFLLRILFMKNIESKDFYKIIVRLKNIFSGRYFPLSMLGILFLNISMVMPFAYSFFVPTQIYLKEIDTGTGLKGIGIQLIWIFVFYQTIKFFWKNKNKKEEKKEWNPEFEELKGKKVKDLQSEEGEIY